jgi:murein L,D-transpeptidase YcbB/YkuD
LHAAIAILMAGLLGATSVGSDDLAGGRTVRELLPGVQADEALSSPAFVADFYVGRDWSPAWTADRPAHPMIHAVLRALDAARADGLDPGRFHVDDLTSLAHVHDRRLSARDLARRDVLLTDAVLTLGRRLAGALVDPGTLYEKWLTPSRDAAATAPLVEALETGRGLTDALDALRPADPAYHRLCEALACYRALADAGGWPAVSEGPTLHPGDVDPRVAALRARLAAEDPTVAAADSAERFDETLARAIVAFQARHGLWRDGVVGPATLAALNVPARDRVERIVVNLERLRWQPRDPGERHIRVNIPAYRLEAVENGESVLAMRAVVGRTDRPTPVLSGALTYLELNPYWNIPQKIARADVLPRVRRDPGYLAERNIRVYESWQPGARELEPQAIDWAAIPSWDLAFKLRQEPGPQNALGRIKFMFANPWNVYIHDTPDRGLFDRARRSCSSGCVRVERPLALASWLLPESGELLEHVDSLETLTLGLPRPVPVHFTYLTAWADPDGTVHFRDDIYAYDEVLIGALAAR